MSYPVKRAIGHPDPRMLVQAGYGGFEYMKVITGTPNGDYAVWIFDSEAGRSKFVKEYGGVAGVMNDDWVPFYYQRAYKDAMKQQAQAAVCPNNPLCKPPQHVCGPQPAHPYFYGPVVDDPPGLDPDCNLNTYCIEWAPGVWGLSFELGGHK